jgi:drug/metabolite transporter (DMT)-like permease
MDLRRLRIGEWLAGLAGLVLAASLFLHWYSGRSAWESLSIADVLLAVVAVLAMALPLAAAVQRSPALATGTAPLVTILGMVGLVVVAIRALTLPDVGPGETERDVGLWIGLAACAAVIAGGWRSMADDRIPRPSGVRSAEDVELLPAPDVGTGATGTP